jgi:hypothetical protein
MLTYLIIVLDREFTNQMDLTILFFFFFFLASGLADMHIVQTPSLVHGWKIDLSTSGGSRTIPNPIRKGKMYRVQKEREN